MASISGGMSIARLRSISSGMANSTSDSTHTNTFSNRCMKIERMSVSRMRKEHAI